MARQSPKESEAKREALRDLIRKETEEDMLRRINREAMEGIRRMGGAPPLPQAADEIAPGYYITPENNMALVSARRRRRRRVTGMV